MYDGRTMFKEIKLVIRDDVKSKHMPMVELGRQSIAYEIRLRVHLVFVHAVLDAHAFREARLVDFGAEHFDLDLVGFIEEVGGVFDEVVFTARFAVLERNHSNVQTPFFRSLQHKCHSGA